MRGRERAVWGLSVLLVYDVTYLEAALIAEQAGQTIHERVGGQELANAQQVQNGAEDAVNFGNPGDGALHEADRGDGGKEVGEADLGGNVEAVVVHGHEGGGAHGVADVLKVRLTRHLQHLVGQKITCWIRIRQKRADKGRRCCLGGRT